jgi:hypothetical protein
VNLEARDAVSAALRTFASRLASAR